MIQMHQAQEVLNSAASLRLFLILGESREFTTGLLAFSHAAGLASLLAAGS